MLTQAALPGAIAKRQSLEHGSDGGTSAPIAQWLHAAGTGEPSAESRAKYFSRSQLATLAALFMLTASTAGYLGVVTGQNIAARRIAAFAPDAARWPVLAHKTAEAAPPAAGGDTVSAPSADTNSDVKRIDTTRSARTRTKPLPIKVARAPAEVPQPDPSEIKPPVTPKATRELPTHSWSVQIASTLEEKAALQLQEKLKTQGYDAFIVGAEVNSAPWYRVRVGRFSAKQEAEATRQTLQSKSNIRSAFVIGN
jgi:cell division septation protein DedD